MILLHEWLRGKIRVIFICRCNIAETKHVESSKEQFFLSISTILRDVLILWLLLLVMTTPTLLRVFEIAPVCMLVVCMLVLFCLLVCHCM